MTSERRLERVLAESQNHQQQLQEQLSQQLSHALSSALTNRMDKVLREEMKKTVPPSKHTVFDRQGKNVAFITKEYCEKYILKGPLTEDGVNAVSVVSVSN